ncbi:MAG: 30S ribosomal protein S9 [Candidatus Nanosyncoccaceae bacterium]|jgi:small subunit ribosomal protein S9
MANLKYVYGSGRRKSATASVRLVKGKGGITINGRTLQEYFAGDKKLIAEITDPLALVDKQKEFDVIILVKGGGWAGQVDAIKLAIAKALVTEFPDLRPVLKQNHFLKRDPREKERKKYGLRKSRKKEQFSKR